MRRFHRIFRITMLSGFLALLIAASSARAGIVTLQASDGLGGTSFTTALNWSNGAAPNASNDYYTNGFVMRTPDGSGTPGKNNITFAGASLTLDGGGINYKGIAGKTMTINNLTFAGGGIFDSATTAGTIYVAGSNMTTRAGTTSTLDAQGRTMQMQSSIGGSGNLTLGSGTVILAAANNTISGAITLGSGTLITNGVSCISNATLNFSSGAISFNGYTAQRIGALSGTSALSINGMTSLDGADYGLILGSSLAGKDAIYSGNLSGNGILTKVGANTQTLNGTAGYTGATYIKAGKLVVNGPLSSSAVTVSGGALGGTGTISGAVTIQSGGHYAPGNSVGMQHVGTLTMGVGSIYDFEFNTTPANDQIIVDNLNGLTINGGGFNFYAEGGTSQAVLAEGYYRLIQYSGILGGDISNLSVLNGTPSGKLYSFDISNDAGWIDLKVTSSTLATTYNLATTATYVNLLVGGRTAVIGTVTNGPVANGDTLTYDGVMVQIDSGPGTVSGTAISGTAIAQGASNSTTDALLTGTGYGTVSLSSTIGSHLNATLGGDANSGTNDPLLIHVGIGVTGANHTFGAALHGGTSNGDSAAGLASRSDNLLTVASIISGTATNDVLESWRTTNGIEAVGNGLNGLISDVVKIENVSSMILEMSYSQTALDNQYGAGLTPYLARLIGATWTKVDSVVDTTAHTVRSVNTLGAGTYAVIPEPGTLALLGAAVTSLLAFALRKRK